MLIVTADDYGRERHATDSILLCGAKGRITSASAMVFMQDSERAAALARDSPVEFGLHLNFTEPPNGAGAPEVVCRHLDRVRLYLRLHRLAPALYNPRLQHSFRILVEAQQQEYERQYRTVPAFYNGHHHMHLCSNVLLGGLIPRASRIRTTFTFESGEKTRINRAYRRMLTRWVRIRYTSTDAFHSIQPIHDLERLRRLILKSQTQTVEIETHPESGDETTLLLGDGYQDMLGGTRLGGFRDLVKREGPESASPMLDGTVRQ